MGLVLGLSRLIQLPAVTGTIGFVGGGMLVWMGWGICREAFGRQVDFAALGAQGAPHQTRLSPMLAGVITSVSNPFWSLWWATVGSGYVMIALLEGAAGVATFFGGHILSDLAWFSLISFGVHRGRNVIGNGVYQGILAVCGVCLIALGGYFLYSGYSSFTAMAA